MSYPRSLSYFANKLSGFSRNKIKLYSNNPATVAKSNSRIVVTLPENSLIDLSTFSMHFDWSMTGTNAGTANMPKHIESIIKQVSCEINGQIVQLPHDGYNQLNKIFWDYTGQNKDNQRAALQNSQADTLYTVPSQVGTGASAVNYAAIYNWLGLLGSIKPRVLDTSLTGTVRIYIQLDSDDILQANNNTNGLTYAWQLNNVSFSADILSINDGLYNQMIQKRLEHGAIEMLFNQYYAFLGSTASAGQNVVRFGLSSQSVDMVLCTVLANNATNTVRTQDAKTKSSVYFNRGSTGLVGATGVAITSSYLSVNGIQYPLYSPSTPEILSQTLHAMGESQDLVCGTYPFGTLGATSGPVTLLNTFETKFFLHAFKFNATTDPDERLVSGLDTRGTNAQLSWTVNALGPGDQPLVFVQTTASLQIGAGKQIQVIL
jgi:hypothetical protein